MKCENCIHNDLCYLPDNDYVSKKELENCDYFKDKNKFIELPCKVGEECYILKLPLAKIEKATVLFPCLATKNESGTQIMNMRNVFKTKEEAEQALKGGNDNEY